MIFRKATITELDKLNQFLRDSKGVWGYSDSFLDDFIKKFGLTENHLQTNEVMMFEENSQLKAIFSFSYKSDEAKLDDFFVAPALIRQGLGKLMWQAVLEYACAKNWPSFILISDPNAQGFYEKMGAVKIADHETFSGRFVPVMRYTIFSKLLNSAE